MHTSNKGMSTGISIEVMFVVVRTGAGAGAGVGAGVAVVGAALFSCWGGLDDVVVVAAAVVQIPLCSWTAK